MKINRDMWRMDRAVEVIIVVWLVIAAILVASGVFRGDSEKRHKVHQWETMYEDNVLKVERCQCAGALDKFEIRRHRNMEWSIKSR